MTQQRVDGSQIDGSTLDLTGSDGSGILGVALLDSVNTFTADQTIDGGSLWVKSADDQIRIYETDAADPNDYYGIVNDFGLFTIYHWDDSGAGSAATILEFDPATSITNFDGSVQLTGQILASDGGGSPITPSYTFASDTDTGIYSDGANTLSFATSGRERIVIDAGGVATFYRQARVISQGGSFIVAQSWPGENDAFQGHLTKDDAGQSIGFFGSIPSDPSSAITAYTWQTSGSPNAWNRVFGAHMDSKVLQLTETDITYDNVSLFTEAGGTMTGNLTINVGANAGSRLFLGESTTLRGDSQDGTIRMYGEQAGTIEYVDFNFTGSNFQFTGSDDFSMQFLNGLGFSVYNTAITDSLKFKHDGTNGIISTELFPEVVGSGSALVFARGGTTTLTIEVDGTLSVPAGSPGYEALVTDDDDIPNKKYVDDLVTSNSGAATVTHTTYTATGGSPAQDTFTGPDDNGDGLSYVAGFLDVYLNGVLLVDGTDYTATDGTSVVLTTAAAGGDILQTTAHASALGTSTPEFIYTATAGQTTFSGADDNAVTLSYVAGQTYVFQNGVMLANGTDYTATDTTSVVLTVAAALDDTIQIIAPLTFTIASAYTKAESDEWRPTYAGPSAADHLYQNTTFEDFQAGFEFTDVAPGKYLITLSFREHSGTDGSLSRNNYFLLPTTGSYSIPDNGDAVDFYDPNTEFEFSTSFSDDNVGDRENSYAGQIGRVFEIITTTTWTMGLQFRTNAPENVTGSNRLFAGVTFKMERIG